MKNIGLLSDTHNYLDKNILDFFCEVEEIWHAGDIGAMNILEALNNIAPTKAVFGNIDGQDIRKVTSMHHRFQCEGMDVWMTHIGGYPGKYSKEVKPGIFRSPPDLFICGHSHILKIMHDKKLGFLHINPGAAGKFGFHKVRTALRFKIHETKISDIELLELSKKT